MSLNYTGINMEEEDVKQPDLESPDLEVENEEGEVTPESEQVKPGEKTDPALLLESLKNEREKRRLVEEEKVRLEEQLQTMRDNLIDESELSDEGKILKKQIDDLNHKLVLKDVEHTYPVIKEKITEFNEFCKQYPKYDIDKLAKLFLSENGLLETSPARKGLEKTTGGTRTPPQTGISVDDVKHLRETNYRKYSQLLREGKIKL